MKLVMGKLTVSIKMSKILFFEVGEVFELEVEGEVVSIKMLNMKSMQILVTV